MYGSNRNPLVRYNSLTNTMDYLMELKVTISLFGPLTSVGRPAATLKSANGHSVLPILVRILLLDIELSLSRVTALVTEVLETPRR